MLDWFASLATETQVALLGFFGACLIFFKGIYDARNKEVEDKPITGIVTDAAHLNRAVQSESATHIASAIEAFNITILELNRILSTMPETTRENSRAIDGVALSLDRVSKELREVQEEMRESVKAISKNH